MQVFFFFFKDACSFLFSEPCVACFCYLDSAFLLPKKHLPIIYLPSEVFLDSSEQSSSHRSVHIALATFVKNHFYFPNTTTENLYILFSSPAMEDCCM